MRAVTNAGPLIHLSWIGHLDLLRELFEEILVPPAVRDEVLRASPDVPGVEALRSAFAAGWLTVRSIEQPAAVAALAAELDRGESEAIVLMQAAGADLLLLDERRARTHARRLGLPLTGTIGLLRLARARGRVPAVAPVIEELRRRGFRMSTELLEQIRREESGR